MLDLDAANWQRQHAEQMQMRFNVSNITNQKYRTPSSGTTINAVKYGTVNANTVFYYLWRAANWHRSH